MKKENFLTKDNKISLLNTFKTIEHKKQENLEFYKKLLEKRKNNDFSKAQQKG